MARAGGEAGKLGDRYEAVWTVDSLLDVLSGEAVSLTVEPFSPEQSLGIEFKKRLGNADHFHSAKRQTTSAHWTLSDLTRREENGRSILGDLLDKLEIFPSSEVVFVSGTTAQHLKELCDAAKLSDTVEAFEERLKTLAKLLFQKFEKTLLLPRFSGDLHSAWQALRRVSVIGITENELIRRVEQRIRFSLYAADGQYFDAKAIRSLMMELPFEFFGQAISRTEILGFLRGHGLAERDWARESNVRDSVEKRNRSYLRNVEAELIANERISRPEAVDIAEDLANGVKKNIVVIGAAGLGKSCLMAQIISRVEAGGVPVLALRLDRQIEALTSKSLGSSMGLPESPALVLAGIANGERCVLAIDQLDAISFASGRNQNLWEAFEEILHEAKGYPQMRVLLACRKFDSDHDPRLRRILSDENNAGRIELEVLSGLAVREVLKKAEIDPSVLDPRHINLLRAPLNLSLYLQSEPKSKPRFSGIHELLERYWDHKRSQVSEKIGKNGQWYEIIRFLTYKLSAKQTLSTAMTTLDHFDPIEIRAMASQNVIVIDDKVVRFFHESFFDYCCARVFAEQDQTIVSVLLESSSEQHLFRRAQVRQIFEFQREKNFEAYIIELTQLLTDSSIRYHLKQSVVDWLGSLPLPRREEWTLLSQIDPKTSIGRAARNIAWNRPPWVILLGRLGVFTEWLKSGDSDVVRNAIHLLSLPNAMKDCSQEIAEIVRPYFDGTMPWNDDYRGLFFFGESYHSREMFELFLSAIRGGLLEPSNRRDWMHYDQLAKVRPVYVVEIIALLLDKTEDDDLGSKEREDAHSVAFIIETAKRAPEDYLKEFFPRVISRLSKFQPDLRIGLSGKRKRIRRPLYISDFYSAIEDGLFEAATAVARENPGLLDELAAESSAEQFSHETIASLMLAAWTSNGLYYSDKIVEYLLEDVRRMGFGTIYNAASYGCSAIRVSAPLCSEKNYALLEGAVLSFEAEHERKDLKRRGYYRMLLLNCLPFSRMSQKAKLNFEQLKRKFPWEKFIARTEGPTGGLVQSPIPRISAKKMNNKQWLNAMRAYSKDDHSEHKDFLVGGKEQLSRVLAGEAQVEKERFSKLVLEMDDSYEPEYFTAILEGITRVTAESDPGLLPQSAKDPLAVEMLAAVLKRLHRVTGKPFGKEICWAVSRITKAGPSKDILSVVCYYAINDPDPAAEEWLESVEGGEMWGGDSHFHGMNSTRGAAAEALAGLLFDVSEDWYSDMRPTIEVLISDPSLAVRTCVILCLIAVLNVDREEAVRFFVALSADADSILGTTYSEQFFNYTYHHHYEQLRPLLLRMIGLPNEGVNEIAGRQISLASFNNCHAREDLKMVMAGSESCRSGAAEIFSHNINDKVYGPTCIKHLSSLFYDPASKVRNSASACFRNLSSEFLSKENDFIAAFIGSPSCLEDAHDMTLALKECSEALPEITIRFAERVIDGYKASLEGEGNASYHWVYELPSLIARLYEQSESPDVMSRCLDLIDEMLRIGVGGIEAELEQIER